MGDVDLTDPDQLRVAERFLTADEDRQAEIRRLYEETRQCCKGCCFEAGCRGCIPCETCIPTLVEIGWWTEDDAIVALAEHGEMSGK